MNATNPAADPAALLAAIVESSDDAIIGKSLDGTVLSWNAAAERIFGWSAAEMIGRNIRTLIPDERLSEEDTIIASISASRRVPTFETVRLRKDGGEVIVAVTVSPVLDSAGQVAAASKIARDITEQKRIETQLRDADQRFRLLADNISQLAWITDSTGWIFWYNKRWYDYTGTTLEQMEGWGWSQVHHPDHIERVTALWQDHLVSGQPWEDTFPLRGEDGVYRWFLSRAVPIHDEDGQIVFWFGSNTDVTEMRDAEQRIELLLQEVNHRSKNMLAIVQSLARRTEGSHGEFVEKLEKRIRGLAANQDVLVRRAWSSIPVAEMIEAQLRSLGESQAQVICEGPQVLLSPGAAEALAMAIHEMGTNALKYGALSVPDGVVRIGWSIDDEPAGAFRIAWTESGGPAVTVPERKGFGSRIMIDVPRVKLSAKVTAEFPDAGFHWTLECPAGSLL